MVLKILIVSLIAHILALVGLFYFSVANLTSISLVNSLTQVFNFVVLIYFWKK